MNLNFKTGINEKEFDEFVRNFPNTNFMQLSSWGRQKKDWSFDLTGIYKNDKIIASAMILKRKIFLNKTILYIPRGLVVDYSDDETLTFFINELKKYAKKNNAIMVKMDPFCAFSEFKFNLKTGEKKEIKNSEFVALAKTIDKKLKENGLKHGGYSKNIGAYIQPRYTMVIPLFNEFGKYSEDDLKKTFPKNTRNYIGQYQEKRGIEFSYSKDKKDVEKLVHMLSATEKRQNIKLRNKEYFENMMNNFEDATLFMAEIDFDKYLAFLEADKKENPNKLEFCNEKIEETNKLKKKYGNKCLLGATIVLMPTCKKGIKIASFLYAGTNTEVLPCLKATNGLMFYRLCYALNNNCDYCDLGGIDGNLNDHLTTFKSKFNPNVLELVGEYNLIINKLLFRLFNLAIKIKKRK